MKTQNLILGAVLTAAFALNAQAVVFSPSDLGNRAVANSPRAKEEFPWLARSGGFVTSTRTLPATVQNNPAYAASPRVREQFPELAVGGAMISANMGSATALDRVLQNTALAASPRMKEQYPQLNRNGASAAAFEVAPVK